ncbi:proteasome regulatory subunit Rpn12 family [Cryptosporidium sp. chipmunk genotype I]|uniref:proteasome regulatory subunit Rpn12 family n=1 Tax=Cryptosporidium sp. chipmunk genotype I TaxID=1280935 RepID=UPI003519F58A|nr:proteasome regulatory subunit Rpn12 family [Cryptosporidium sp. chipmunk genotype I]
MVDTSKILALLQQAKVEIGKNRSDNLNKLSNLIKELKIMLIELPSLSLSSKEIDLTELVIARDVLEISVLVSVRKEDLSGFERDFLNLQRYYIDYESILEKSENQDMIKGLYLLYLLSCDRISDFHIALEIVSPNDQENKFISFSKKLELYLLDGNYSKIMQMQSSLPTPDYQIFFKELIDTCREKVAKCIECSYDKISIDKLKSMMRFSTNEELISFINEMSPNSNRERLNTSKVHWKLIDSAVYFEKKSSSSSNNLDLISNTLGYAIELERII